MTNVVNLDEYRECELLGSVNIYREANGAILLGVTYMEPKQIERVETIASRFEQVRTWLEVGLSSLRKQALEFEE